MMEAAVLITAMLIGIGLGIPIGWWMRKNEQKRIDLEKREAEIRIKRVQRLRAGRDHPPREGAGPPIKVHKIRIRRR